MQNGYKIFTIHMNSYGRALPPISPPNQETVLHVEETLRRARSRCHQLVARGATVFHPCPLNRGANRQRERAVERGIQRRISSYAASATLRDSFTSTIGSG